MNKTSHFLLAFEAQDYMQKQASDMRIAYLFDKVAFASMGQVLGSRLGSGLGRAAGRGMGVLGAAGRGFGNVSRANGMGRMMSPPFTSGASGLGHGLPSGVSGFERGLPRGASGFGHDSMNGGNSLFSHEPNMMGGEGVALQPRGLPPSNFDSMNLKYATTWLSKALGHVTDAAAPIMKSVQPTLDAGFGRIGQAAGKIQNPMLARLLTGAEPGAMAGYDAVPAATAMGKTVAKRVGIGAGAAYGGAVGLEAPGKYENNEAYAQQEQHPIRAWLAQHLLGQRKLQDKGYLNPL